MRVRPAGAGTRRRANGRDQVRPFEPSVRRWRTTAYWKSSTTRPSILPCFIRSKIALMSVSGAVVNSAFTFPSTAKAMASSRSRLVPTIDPRTVMRLSTTSKIGVGKFAGRQSDEADGPLAADHVQRLPEGGCRDRRHQHAMGAAAGDLQHALDRILRQRVDGLVRAALPRQRQLVLGDVEPDHLEAHRLGILDRDVPEAADA